MLSKLILLGSFYFIFYFIPPLQQNLDVFLHLAMYLYICVFILFCDFILLYPFLCYFTVILYSLLYCKSQVNQNCVLSYDVGPGSEITPCNKIDKPHCWKSHVAAQ